jgi:hypothetical protein
MMNITTHGYSQATSDVFGLASHYYAQELMPESVVAKLNVDIISVPRQQDGDIIYNAECHCIRPKGKRSAPTTFEVHLFGRTPLKSRLSDLAHEWVHIAQYATKRRRDYYGKPTKLQFDGKDYDIRQIGYYDQPWEIEANGLEVSLVGKFLESYPSIAYKLRPHSVQGMAQEIAIQTGL